MQICFSMNDRMKKFIKLLIVLIFFFLESEGKLDIKCINGKPQRVDVSKYEYGNIYSPGYTEGKPYPNDIFCQVQLRAQVGKYVRLTFDYLDLALNPGCEDTNLVVVNYLNETTLQAAGGYCGYVRVRDIVSVTNVLEIRFKSSFIGTGLGFNITYREVANQKICKDHQLECRNRRCISKKDSVCNGEDDCGDGTDEEDCDYPVETPATCGKPETEPYTGNYAMDRVVGGREAVRGSWPWQVDMQLAVMLPNGHFCGGTLLNSQWFVTAAHCIGAAKLPYMARIHLGNHHKYKEDRYEQVRYMKEYFIYGVNTKEYLINGEFDMNHDLALVKMNAPVKMNPHVQVACLPQQNEELTTGQNCYSSGWGLTRGSQFESVLKQAQHPIHPASRCKNDMIPFNNKTMICAGRLEALNGLCHGDSGGPLVCKKDGKWFVHGATSFLTDTDLMSGLCGLPKTPAVFSKISAKVDWIKSTISQNS